MQDELTTVTEDEYGTVVECPSCGAYAYSVFNDSDHAPHDPDNNSVVANILVDSFPGYACQRCN